MTVYYGDLDDNDVLNYEDDGYDDDPYDDYDDDYAHGECLD